MRRTWVKFYCDQWLRGSIRKEPIEVRAMFADLLAMAGDNGYGEDGMIQLADGVGFTDELIAGILNVPLKTWLSVKKRLSNHTDSDENRIEIIPLSQGFAIRILKWKHYQSEYNRQKPYRESKKEKRSPTPPKKEKRDIDIDIEGDIEEKVTKVTTKVTTKELPPIPKHLDFKIQDELKEMRAHIRKLKRLYKKKKTDEILADITARTKEYEEAIEDFSD